MLLRALPFIAALIYASAAWPQSAPRTADGKPNLQGIWQVHNRAAVRLAAARRAPRPAGRRKRRRRPRRDSVPAGGARAEARELREPRGRPIRSRSATCPACRASCTWSIPFQIFQTAEHVAITFEWSQVYRLIYTNGKPTLHEGIESWMGNSRGRWEGDTLVVEVTDHNDRTWLDAAGNFHSNALSVTERYSLRDANTIDYEVTIDDPQRVHAAVEDRDAAASPDRLPRGSSSISARPRPKKRTAPSSATYAPGIPRRAPAGNAPFDARASAALPAARGAARRFARLPDGKPDLSGWYQLGRGRRELRARGAAAAIS